MAITTVSQHVVSVNAIQGTLIADNAITAVHIATNAVSGTLIADNAVTATHIAQNTITVTQIADDAIEAAKLADGIITTNHLNKAMISSQTEVTPVAGDFVLIGDTSDSNNLKKAPLSGVVALGGVDGISSSADATAITIDSSEKVGIGTTSPAQKLEVAGRIRATTDPTFEAFESSSKRGGLQWDSTNDYTNIFSVGGDIRFDIGGELMRLTSTGLGIGTNSPSQLLELSHASQPVLQLTDAGGTNQYGQVFQENGVLHLQARDNTSGGVIAFQRNAGGSVSESARIDSSGNVAIGTTTTTNDAKLIVDSGDGSHPAIKASDGGSNGFTMLADNYTATESNCNFGSSYSSAALVLSASVKVSDSADNTYLSSQAQYAAKPTAMRLQQDGIIRFLSQSGSATTAVNTAVSMIERMRITDVGNVGIGEDTPLHPLQISGGLSDAYHLTFDRGNSTPGGDDPWLGLYNNQNIANATYGWGWYDSSSDGSLQLWNRNNSTTGYVVLSAKRGGNVGIGTASPATKLHVMTASNGASTVGGASDELILENSSDCGLTIRSGSSSDGVISFADADDHNVGQIYYEHDNNAMVFRTNDSEAIKIDSLGNLSSAGTGGHVQIDNGVGVTTRETMAASSHAWQTNTYNVLTAGATSIGTDSTGTSHMWWNSYDTGSKYSVKAGHSADMYHDITHGGWYLRMSSNPTTSNGEGITMLTRFHIDKDSNFNLHSAGTNDTTIKFYKGASTIKWWIQNDTAGSPGSDSFWIGDEENDNGVYVAQDGSSWSGISDERLKRNWTNLENATDKIKTLTKVGTFQRRGKTTGKWSDNREVGLSAQEVEAILPEAVTTGGDIEFASDDKVTGVKGLSYDKLVPLLVKSIQELEARIKTLES